MKFQHFSICSIRWLDNHHHYYLQKICHRVGWHIFDLEVLDETYFDFNSNGKILNAAPIQISDLRLI